MLIISKNKDYYDGVVGTMGIDKTLVYERKTVEITENKLMLKEFQYKLYDWNDRNPFLKIGNIPIDSKKNNKYTDYTFFIVGFCGELYLGWKFHYKVKGNINDILKTDIIYGYDNAKNFLKDDYWSGSVEDDINYVMNYDPIDMFREINSPIFIFEKDRINKLIINPTLKKWKFYRLFDSFQAFQEISMFLGGVLGRGEKDIVEIGDKYKIRKYGFDKWSFRKEPSKRK